MILVMAAVRAIFEKGVFGPIGPVNLPDNAQVEFEPRVLTAPTSDAAIDDTSAMAGVYEVLSRTYDTDCTDLAAKHDEHQP